MPKIDSIQQRLNLNESTPRHMNIIRKIVSFELGKEIAKDVYRLVTRVWQRKILSLCGGSNLRPTTLRYFTTEPQRPNGKPRSVNHEIEVNRYQHETEAMCVSQGKMASKSRNGLVSGLWLQIDTRGIPWIHVELNYNINSLRSPTSSTIRRLQIASSGVRLSSFAQMFKWPVAVTDSQKTSSYSDQWWALSLAALRPLRYPLKINLLKSPAKCAIKYGRESL